MKRKQKIRFIIGIDEVGRGALAGPVVVGAFAHPVGVPPRNAALGRLKDSKKLTSEMRRKWCDYFAARSDFRHCIARSRAGTVDRVNVSRAANLAAHRALTRLFVLLRAKPHECKIILDGGLYIKDKHFQKQKFPSALTANKADENMRAVAAASVLAKVGRDTYMEKADGRFPGYGFALHKGYGTSLHREALRRLGLTPLHRATFCSF